MTRIAFAALGALASLCGAPAHAADDDLKLSGTFRVRYEGVHGQLRPGFNRDESVVGLRTTLRAEYGSGPISLFGELWDSRMYGTNSRSAITNSEVNALELSQAYVSANLDGALGDGSKLKIDLGRMMVNIGSRRLIAADDYRNTANAQTGLRAEFSAGQWVGQLVAGLPHYRLPDDKPSLLDNKVKWDRESFDSVIWGGTVGRKHAIGKAMVEASYFHFDEDDSPQLATRDRTLDTYGGRIIRDPAAGVIDYEVEALRQTGSIRASTAPAAAKLAVRAWYLHAEVGHMFAGAWKPRIALEYDQSSGDGPGARFTRFDTLFGMRRGDFLPSGIYAAIGRANIIQPGIRIEVTPKRGEGFLAYRPTWADSATDSFSTSGVRDITGASGRFAGHVFDARARYWLIPDQLRVEANAAFIVNGRLLTDAPNGLPRDTSSYLSLALQAQF